MKPQLSERPLDFFSGTKVSTYPVPVLARPSYQRMGSRREYQQLLADIQWAQEFHATRALERESFKLEFKRKADQVTNSFADDQILGEIDQTVIRLLDFAPIFFGFAALLVAWLVASIYASNGLMAAIPHMIAIPVFLGLAIAAKLLNSRVRVKWPDVESR